MNFQPIDLPSLLRTLIGPPAAAITLIVFRGPLGELVKTVGRRAHKVSISSFSLELTEVAETKTQTLDTEIRQLEAGLVPNSASTALFTLFTQLQQGERRDYIVIDLGAESSPRWLTSRLYLLALLITLINRPICLVFVETVGGMRNRLIGLASADRVRWSSARRYGWLESASAAAYAMLGGVQFDPKTSLYSVAQTGFQFDVAPRLFTDYQLNTLVQQFLANIRSPQPVPAGPPADPADWVALSDGVSEHAKWIDGGRIERLMGNDLSGARVVLLPNKTVNDVADAILNQPGRFVAVVDPDRTFQGLIDRSSALESLAREFVKEAGQAKAEDES